MKYPNTGKDNDKPTGNRNHDPRYVPSSKEQDNTNKVGETSKLTESGNTDKTNKKLLIIAGVSAACCVLLAGITLSVLNQRKNNNGGTSDAGYVLLDNAEVTTNTSAQNTNNTDENKTSDTENDTNEVTQETEENQETEDPVENADEGQGGSSALLDYLNDDASDVLVPTQIEAVLGSEAISIGVKYDVNTHTVILNDGLMLYAYGLLPVSTDRQRDALIVTLFMDEMTISDPVIIFSEAPAILTGAIQKIEVGDTSYTFELNGAGQLIHITEVNGYFGSGETTLNYDNSGYLTTIEKSDAYNSQYLFEYNAKHEILNFECKGRGKDILQLTNTSYFRGLFMTAVGYQKFTDCDRIDYAWSYDDDERLTGIDWEYYTEDGEVSTYHFAASYTDDNIESYSIYKDEDRSGDSSKDANYGYSRFGDIK